MVPGMVEGLGQESEHRPGWLCQGSETDLEAETPVLSSGK